jgi:hypothetical protein
MPAAKGKTSGSSGKKGAKPSGAKSAKKLTPKKKPAASKSKAAPAPARRKPAPASSSRSASAKKPAKTAAKKPPAKPVKKKAAPAKPAKPVKKVAAKPAPKAKPSPPKKAAPAKKAAPPKKAPRAIEKPTPAAKVKTVAAAAVKKTADVTRKATERVKASGKPTVAAVAAVAGAAAQPVAKKVVAAVQTAAADDAPRRARRGRTRIHSDEGPIANWITMNGAKPRPSSFIPAPPRAEAPSNAAAPPASSDRIIRPEDLATMSLPAIRTFPVRVEIEQSLGRTHVIIQPNQVSIRPGDGLEWDFRYLGGADTFVQEMILEFASPLFGKKVLNSRNPGSARPHRLLSGRASADIPTGSHSYKVKCKSLVGTEVAESIGLIVVS